MCWCSAARLPRWERPGLQLRWRRALLLLALLLLLLPGSSSAAGAAADAMHRSTAAAVTACLLPACGAVSAAVARWRCLCRAGGCLLPGRFGGIAAGRRCHAIRCTIGLALCRGRSSRWPAADGLRRWALHGSGSAQSCSISTAEFEATPCCAQSSPQRCCHLSRGLTEQATCCVSW